MVNIGFIKTLLVACALVAALAPATVQGLEEIKCTSGGNLYVKGHTSSNCLAVAAAFNRLPGGFKALDCSTNFAQAQLITWDSTYSSGFQSWSEGTRCKKAAAVWNKFPDISGVLCTETRYGGGQYGNGDPGNPYGRYDTMWKLYVRTNTCASMARKMNKKLENAARCNAVGEFQPDGTCKCTDPATIGPACEFSNAKTCSGAGVVDAAGQCTCTDPAVGVGPACEFSNAKTCSGAGVVDAAGQCTCTDTAIIGPACEFSNAKTCSGAGVVDAAGRCTCTDPVVGAGLCDCSDDMACPFSNATTCSGAGMVDAAGQCTCTDPAVGVGPACEFSNAKTCSGAGVVDAAGQCTCTDPAVGVGPACEFSNAKTCSGAGVVDAAGQCTCTDPAVGVGPACEFSNAKTCSGAGVVDTAGQCTCTDPAIIGPACEFSNAMTCSGAGVVDAAGQCTCTDPTVGVGPACEFSNAKTCSGAGVVDAAGQCTCTDTAIIGPACEFSNAKTCSGAGVVDAAGRCTCTDPAVGVGPACEFSNAKTCSGAGVVDAAGRCTCTDPVVGAGLCDCSDDMACPFSNATTCSNSGAAQPDGSCVCYTNDSSLGGIGPACAYTNAETCNDAGTAQPDGSCICNTNDPSLGGIGPACAYTNAETCNDAGTAQPNGSCICNSNDPSLGGIGPACAYTNVETCNDAGIAQPDGSCVCNSPATGLGPTCSEYSNSKTCNNVGTVDSSGKCTCNSPATGLGPTCSEYSNSKTCNNGGTVDSSGKCSCDGPGTDTTGFGPTCIEITNTKNCNNAAEVLADGTCSQPCKIGHTGPNCEQCIISTHDMIEDGTVSRATSCTSSGCSTLTTHSFIKCVLKGGVKECELGEKADGGNCIPCEANTYADGTRLDGSNDGRIRVQCKACPTKTLTRAPKLEGASFEHECIASCPLGQRSQNSSCVNCDTNTFSDRFDADGNDDGGYRAKCKACVAGEVSDVGASICTAKYQAVPGKQFCWGEGLDSKSISASGSEEDIYVLSNVGAPAEFRDAPWKACNDSVNLIFTTSTFIPPRSLNCDGEPKASPEECAAAAGKSGASFCTIDLEIIIGDLSGYPRHLCRDSQCATTSGTCWNPSKRGDKPLPFGCVLNNATAEVMYFTEQDAELYYNGFDYVPICARFICPPDGDNFADRPVPLTPANILANVDAFPECKLSTAGIEAANAAANKRNNTVFIPIAFVLTFLSMLAAYAYLMYFNGQDWSDLGSAEHKFVCFGVGLRSFDMQTDWGFYSINVRDIAFETKYDLQFGIEMEDGSLNVDGVNVSAFQNAVLACCILGLLLTPVDMWGNRQRTLGKASKAMTISIVVLLLEDIPQLGFNIEYMKVMGDVGSDPIAILSLLASIGNILYNLGLLIYECRDGEIPEGTNEVVEAVTNISCCSSGISCCSSGSGSTDNFRVQQQLNRMMQANSNLEQQLEIMTAENKRLKKENRTLQKRLKQNSVTLKTGETFLGFDL